MVYVRSLKDIMTVSVFKTRHDDPSDQYNRIFMTKMLLVASIIMGVDYFSDQVNCMIPTNARHSIDFYHSSCWINGYYIFEEMTTRLDKSGYYGIPQRVDFDGFDKTTDELCYTNDLFTTDINCVPMTRIYYLHYQWMPVYMASLALFFYLPYIVYRVTNTDIVSLKKEIKKVSCDTTPLMKNFFNYTVNPPSQMRLRIFWNLLVKSLYAILGVSAFYVTDQLLLGKYRNYGNRYLQWYNQNNTLKHAEVTHSAIAHAGNELLPSMGYCDVFESSLEHRITFHNRNRFICEISPHILYQYVFMVLWFFFILSIAVSFFGLAHYIATSLCYVLLPCGKTAVERSIIKYLTLREIEYLDIVKKASMSKYGDLLGRLRQQRFIVSNEYDLAEELEKYISTFDNNLRT